MLIFNIDQALFGNAFTFSALFDLIIFGLGPLLIMDEIVVWIRRGLQLSFQATVHIHFCLQTGRFFLMKFRQSESELTFHKQSRVLDPTTLHHSIVVTQK